MVERTRRLRVGFAHSSPGALGATARPNYVGPSGNGLVKRMNAGRKPGGIKGVRMGAPVRLQKAVPRSKEKRRSGAPRGERPTSLGVRRKAYRCYPRLSALRSPHVGEGAFPLVSEGMGNPGAPRALRKQGRRSFEFLHAGCLTCESDVVRSDC